DGYTNTTRDWIDHTYMSPGTYTVSLEISGPAGSSSKTKQGYITVGYASEVLQAEFSENRVGEVPLSARFRDRSSGDLREGITYTPRSGFTGTETFTYTVRNTEGATSNQATVTVTVGNTPVAGNDTAVTGTDTPVTIDILANDLDADGFIEPDTVAVVSEPNNGTAVVNDGDGTITYSPQAAFSGIDKFSYTVEDDSGNGSNEAVVTVIVSDGPVAINDSAITTQGSPVIIDVLANDTHTNGGIEPSTVVITTDPNNGTAEANDIDGTITYRSEQSFTGTDMFAYTVADSNGLVSNQAEVIVTVGNSPVAMNDSAITAEGTPVTIDVLANDVDTTGQIDPGTITIINSPTNGSAVAHNCWLWSFGDGSTSHEQSPRHTYSQPGNYTVSLTVTDVSGSSVTETKPNFVRALVFEKTIDNVDYPKTHYRNKTVLFRKEMEIDKEQLRYTRMLYDSCNTGNYYLGTFNRGIVFYTVANSGSRGSVLYLRAYLEGRSNEQIWEIIQDFEPSYDYYNFNQAPAVLQSQTVSALASDNGIQLVQADLTDTNEPQKQEKIEQLKMLSANDAFERLKDSDFLTDKALLKQGISTAFKNTSTQAVTLSLEKLKGPVKQVSQDRVIHRAGDIYIAKKILAAFPQQSVDALLQLYESGDTITKGNVLSAAGALAGNEDIDNMLIEALDDKSSAEDQDAETIGQALRICDIAYNQLVLAGRIKNVLRTIGTSHSIQVRDYHINVLKNRL
ncbi:MAG TPA: Ig-like domain-containing protein, partial [Sedimentisphaerales bacterium]|nr:Ig-like domain-containing protein [Sedimentisphaerales bacterium]